MTYWDHEADLLIVGSGGGGMSAAITGKREGLNPLILEKTEYYGGSTAISGGGVWIPNNHLMAEAGIEDSKESARIYLKSIIGDRPSDAKVEAFIQHAPEAIKYLSELDHIKFKIMAGYSDYYAEKPGGVMGGRGLMAHVFSGRKLGDMFFQLRPSPVKVPFDFAVTINEIRKTSLAKAYPPFIPGAIWMAVRNVFGKCTGARYVGTGATLIARLRLSLHGSSA